MTSGVLDRLSHSLADRYRIERELGAGGMATVYLAHDLRHDRDVAIKVLHHDLAAALGAERFLREIQIAAQLQHPHIVALIDSGESDGTLFYLMPYVDGETLRARMRRVGPMPLEDVLHIAREVADALAYAHRHGVVHRDIKPENILLADGHAFVADFGIARAVEPAATSLTQTGFALGTPSYMAPEQAVGEKAVDGRADLYALGCVIHEMLTGEPPYRGATQQAILVKRFTEPVPRLRGQRPDAPAWLEALLHDALATDPAERPADAETFRAVLATGEVSAVRTAPPPPGVAATAQSIAVLPFANMSADPETEYFSDGISEELINALTQFPNLKVIARTSSFSFKGRNVDVREIGRALGVRHVLEGSVRRSGSSLRVTAQLIDAADGVHAWSQRYDRTMADVFAIQDEITAAISEAVGGTLLDAHRTAKYETDEETFDLYLRGRALLFESSARFGEAYDLLHRAVQRDPDFVPALVSLADAHCFRVWWAVVPGVEGWRDVRALANDVAARAPGSAVAERLLGAVLSGAERDFVGAEAHLRRAVELNPSDVLTHALLAMALIALGRANEADAHNRRVIALDPLSPMSHVIAANNWAAAGDFSAAEAAATEAIALDPRYPEGYHMRGYTRNYLGRFAEAFDDLVRVPGLGNRSGWPLAKRAIALAGLGRWGDVRRLLEEILARARAEFMTPDAVACVHQLLGENDAAFRWLERAVNEQAGYVGFVGLDAIFAPLRRDVRFAPFCLAHRIPVLSIPRSALDNLSPPSAVPPSIVVLPFDNLSPDPDNAFFADGLSEEIINDLSRLRALRVISRTTAMRFRGSGKDVPTVARELGVRYVLEGSVRRAGQSLRITAQLIDAESDTHLWADKYGGTMDDVFDLQEQLSRRIVDALQLSLTTEESARFSARPIADVQAYEAYLRANAAIGRLTETGMHDAIRDLQTARDIIGENALLCCGTSYAHWFLANIGIDIEPNIAQCGAWAKRALALDAHSAKARALLGMSEIIYRGRKPQPEAIAHLKQALGDDPNEPLALLGLTVVCLYAGRTAEARAFADRYARREPLDVWTFALPIYIAWFEGDFEQGLAASERAVAALGDVTANFLHMAWSLAWLGRHDEALAWVERMASTAPGHVHTKLALMLRHGLARDVAAARAELTPEFHEWCHRELSWSNFVAAAFALAGAEDDALTWLEHAVDLGFINYPFLAERDPFMKSLRGTPRFTQLMDRVRREYAAFEV